MKFIVKRDALLHEITLCQEVISARNNMSVVANAMIIAQDDHITIRATDISVSLETTIPAEVIKPGESSIFCEKLVGVVRSLPTGTIEFELFDNNSVSVKPVSDKMNVDFTMRTMGSDQYPEVMVVPSDDYFDVNQGDLAEMIEQTIFASSDDEARYFLNGIFMELGEGQLIMVATDGRRMAHIAKPVESTVQPFEGIIIPQKVLKLVRRLLSGEGTIGMAVSEKRIFFKLANQFLSSGLIDGQFPNYQRVIPKEHTQEIIVKKSDLLGALKRVSLFAETSQRIYIDLAANSMQLSSDKIDAGVAVEKIDCVYSGTDARLAINYTYFLEPLQVMKSEDVCIRYTELDRAVTVRPKPEAEYLHVVMPMQIA